MRLLRRLLNLMRPGGADADIAEEMEFHRAMKKREFLEQGLNEREANAAAARAMGNVTGALEDSRGVWLPVWIEGLWQDVWYACRSLRRQPGFALAAIATLTAAIGLNTSVFTVFGAAALRPWAVRDPARMVNIYGLATHSPAGMGNARNHSIAEARFLNANSRTFEGIFAARKMQIRIGLAESGDPAAQAMLVTGNYFAVLGVEMQRGRGFLREEDGADPQAVAVLSDWAWRNRLSGDPDPIGKRVDLDGVPFTVVGVASPEFAGTGSLRTDIWVPMTAMRLLRPLDASVPKFLEDPKFCCSDAAGRLRRGVSREQGQAELAVLSRRFQAQHAGETNGVLLTDTAVLSNPGSKGKTALIGLLPGGVLLILLLACANVGNLLLARAAGRRREIATRVSIGASRGRIVRQLLTESLVLALAAAGPGLAIASVLPARAIQWTTGDPLTLRLEPDWTVVAFSLGISMLAALLFGLAPAIQATRPVASRLRLRGVLLGAQVALSVILLVGAGLMTRGVREAGRRDPRFAVNGVTVVSFDLPASSYNTARVRAFADGLEDALAAAPGLGANGLARTAPLANSHSWTSFRKQGEDATRDRLIETQEVGGDYFGALGIPLVAGRNFERRDSGRGVAIVNEAMARRYFGGDAVGKAITLRSEVREVIGVVKDTYSAKLDSIDPLLYERISGRDVPRLIVRATPAEAASALAAIAKRLDPRVQVRAEPLSAEFERHLAPARAASVLAGVLGLLALGLASVGMSGVFAYVVRERTREIGIRMALGARPGQVLRLVFGESARPAMAGLAAGVVAAAGLSRLVESHLYGVSGFDPAAYVAVCVALGGAGVVASWLPARRAIRVEPVKALRYE